MDIASYDQRARLVFCVLTAFLFSFLQAPQTLLAALAASVMLAAAARCSAARLLKSLAPANFFLLFLLLTVPWGMPGDPVWSLGPLSFSREGLELVFGAAVKCNAILISFLVLSADMSIADMGAAMEKLRVPRKLVFLFLFTFRQVHVISEEWKRMRTAAALRGFRPRTSLHTYRTLASMIGMTVVGSIDRSRRAYEAMQLRGFRGMFRTVSGCSGGGACFFLCFAVFLAALAGFDVFTIWKA